MLESLDYEPEANGLAVSDDGERDQEGEDALDDNDGAELEVLEDDTDEEAESEIITAAYDSHGTVRELIQEFFFELRMNLEFSEQPPGNRPFVVVRSSVKLFKELSYLLMIRLEQLHCIKRLRTFGLRRRPLCHSFLLAVHVKPLHVGR